MLISEIFAYTHREKYSVCQHYY